MSTERYSSYIGQDRVDAIYTDAMTRMYGLVALGIVTTGAAIWIGNALGVGDIIFGFSWIGTLVMFGVTLGVLMGASAAANSGYTGLGTTLYLSFAGLEGFFLSPILAIYATDTIGIAFVLTAFMFISMSVVGMTTKRDLSKLGPMLLICLFGGVLILFINIFLIQSSGLSLVVNLVLLPVFLALTVWETKQVKELAQEKAMEHDAEGANQVALIGSIDLYLNALNIFLILLRLLGSGLSNLWDNFDFFSGG